MTQPARSAQLPVPPAGFAPLPTARRFKSRDRAPDGREVRDLTWAEYVALLGQVSK